MSLRGGSEQQAGCLLFRFTGQLDAYSDKNFLAFISEQRANSSLPIVIDLSNIDFIQTVKLVRLEEFLHLQPDLETALAALTT